MRIIAKTTEVAGKVIGSLRIIDAIGGEGANAKGVMDHLDKLRADGAGDLVVSVHSPGGDAFAGIAIHDAIRAWDKGTRTVRVRGLAASAASVVAMAGDRVCLSPNSMLMVHGPKAQIGGLFGAVMSPDDLRKVQAKLEVCRATMANIYAKKTGKTVAECSKLMDQETWFTAKQAVKDGFADEVDSDEDDPEENDDEDLEATDRFRLVAEATWESAPEAAKALLAIQGNQPRAEDGKFSTEPNAASKFARAKSALADAIPKSAPHEEHASMQKEAKEAHVKAAALQKGAGNYRQMADHEASAKKHGEEAARREQMAKDASARAETFGLSSYDLPSK